MEEIRLQKYLADAGVASRRGAEQMIVEGRVSVDGKVVDKLGSKVGAGQEVWVDGKKVGQLEKVVIYAFYKPRGVTSTNADPHARATIQQYFPEGTRVYPVGRLDKDSEGLMIVTNDGKLAYQLTHPKHEHEKEYEIVLVGQGKSFNEFEKGYSLKTGRIRPMQLVASKRISNAKWQVRLILREGGKRQIREVAKILGYEVVGLKRIRIANLKLGNLAPGKWKIVSREEVLGK